MDEILDKSEARNLKQNTSSKFEILNKIQALNPKF